MGNTCKEVLGGEDLQFEIVNDKDQSKYAFKRSVRIYFNNIITKLAKSK